MKLRGIALGTFLKNKSICIFLNWCLFIYLFIFWSHCEACVLPLHLDRAGVSGPEAVSAFISSVQSLGRVQLFATQWTAARQASLSTANSRSLLKLMSIESVMPSNNLILCRPLLLLPSIFPSIRVFLMSQLFASGGQSTGVSASTSVLPVNIQN